jgi:hypothetical protein
LGQRLVHQQFGLRPRDGRCWGHPQLEGVELALADDVGGGLAAEPARQQRLEGSEASRRYFFTQASVDLGSVETQSVSKEDFCLERRVLEAGRR